MWDHNVRPDYKCFPRRFQVGPQCFVLPDSDTSSPFNLVAPAASPRPGLPTVLPGTRPAGDLPPRSPSQVSTLSSSPAPGDLVVERCRAPLRDLPAPRRGRLRGPVEPCRAPLGGDLPAPPPRRELSRPPRRSYPRRALLRAPEGNPTLDPSTFASRKTPSTCSRAWGRPPSSTAPVRSSVAKVQIAPSFWLPASEHNNTPSLVLISV